MCSRFSTLPSNRRSSRANGCALQPRSPHARWQRSLTRPAMGLAAPETSDAEVCEVMLKVLRGFLGGKVDLGSPERTVCLVDDLDTALRPSHKVRGRGGLRPLGIWSRADRHSGRPQSAPTTANRDSLSGLARVTEDPSAASRHRDDVNVRFARNEERAARAARTSYFLLPTSYFLLPASYFVAPASASSRSGFRASTASGSKRAVKKRRVGGSYTISRPPMLARFSKRCLIE